MRPNDRSEPILREIKRWTKASGAALSNRHSALNLTAARLRHIAGTQS